MNRLSPLIVRRFGSGRVAPWPIPALAAARLPAAGFLATAEPAQWLDDLRLFATGWVGGLIFFGTLLG